MIIIVLTSAATLLLLAGFVQDYLRLRLTPRLVRSRLADSELPFVSVLIPARDEARNIARCLDGVLSQQYPAYEVIVVDDGSTDATPEILAAYAAKANRLRVITSRPLPPGWTGKCYACQQAALAARSPWLLFLDADTVPQPTLLVSLVNHAQHYNCDMVTVFPFLELGSFWERLILPPFLSLIMTVFPFKRLSDPDVRPDEVLANGQCILVRRSAYAAIGGHNAVRGEVLEDVQLAQALRRAGYCSRGAEGMQEIRVRMYTNGREVVEGLTKNAAAGYYSGGERSMWGMTRLLTLTFVPLWLLGGSLALVSTRGDTLAWAVFAHAAVVVLVALGFWSILLRHFYKLPWIYAFLWPFGLLCYGAIALRSLWLVRRGRGVVWKGRTYVGE
ncbi:MAG: glycosyltransferase [Chloroflexales bacterium]|nr:glycosyltransferase [Chloroflexales bacterium]